MGRGFVKIGGAEPTLPTSSRPGLAGRPAATPFTAVSTTSSFSTKSITSQLQMPTLTKIVGALKNRPERRHVICTGRNAHPKLVELADLVTENARG